MTALSCPICDAPIALSADTIVAELLTCKGCGTELEVESLDPPTLVEAPTEEEDWGQ